MFNLVDIKYSYLGKSYSNDEIKRAIEEFPDIHVCRPDNIITATAQYIAGGFIVGWFQGCSEFGPRALGNRSILVDPRKSEMKDILNARVKFREHFRPFAPAVLWEHQKEYFDLDIQNSYMLVVDMVKEDKREIIPAVTHVDGTGRIQSVTKQGNFQFYQLIKAFFDITCIPILLNTSFNIKGEPIVETPEDALRCFMKTQIDILSIGEYLLIKNGVMI